MAPRNHGREPIDPVPAECACPLCGEHECDVLGWIDDGERVECQRCQTVYRPGGARNARDDATQ